MKDAGAKNSRLRSEIGIAHHTSTTVYSSALLLPRTEPIKLILGSNFFARACAITGLATRTNAWECAGNWFCYCRLPKWRRGWKPCSFLKAACVLLVAVGLGSAWCAAQHLFLRSRCEQCSAKLLCTRPQVAVARIPRFSIQVCAPLPAPPSRPPSPPTLANSIRPTPQQPAHLTRNVRRLAPLLLLQPLLGLKGACQVPGRWWLSFKVASAQ